MKSFKKVTAMILAVVLILTLAACGAQGKLKGSWYEDGTGELAFTLYGSGDCDLYTWGSSSPGQWSYEDGVLRMMTVINNETYTVESIQGGCMTAIDKRGNEVVFWNSAEAAASAS